MGWKKGLSECLLFAVDLMLTSTISHYEHTHAEDRPPPHIHTTTQREREKEREGKRWREIFLVHVLTVGQQHERGTLTSEMLTWKESLKPQCGITQNNLNALSPFLCLTFLFIHPLGISQQVLKDRPISAWSHRMMLIWQRELLFSNCFQCVSE